MSDKKKKLIQRPKKGNLQIATTTPWMSAKVDSPNQGIILNSGNLKQAIDDTRWRNHTIDKLKTDEQKLKEYTQKQVQNNTKRTWRSDVADVLHGLGEAAMASNPYTATAYFGGKALDGAFKNGITPETVVNAGFAAMPWMHVLAPMILSGVLKGALFMTSNITGKWTPFFGKEYRLNPNIIGINGGGILSRPIYRGVDHMLDEGLVTDDNLIYIGGNRAAEVTNTTPENVVNILRQYPDRVLLIPRMNGRYAILEVLPGALREILLGHEQELAGKGLIPGRVLRRVASSPTSSSSVAMNAYDEETLRRMPEGSLISATDTRIANIPKEELAKKGIGLDMSEGGTPYAESDIFLPNGEVKPGIDLRLFHKSKPGMNNVAYWYPKGKDFNSLPIEEQAKKRVGTYFGATLNRQALRDEAQRIAMHNPTNVSGAYGYLSDFDLNPNSFKSMLGNLRMQVQAGRDLRLLEMPSDEYPFLIPNRFNQAGRYIEELDPQVKQIFMDHYGKHEKYASEQLINKLFGRENAVLGKGNIPVNTGNMSNEEFNRRLANYLEQKASFRKKFLTPNNLTFTKTNEGYRITGDASLGNQDFGILRPNSLDNQYEDLMKSVNTFRLRTGLNIPSPRIIDEGNARGLIDNSVNLPGKFRFIGIPNITIFSRKKGGKINGKKLIKRVKATNQKCS